MSINLLNHWVDELPEFGTSFEIIRLIEEQRKANKEINQLQARVIEIDSELLEKVKTVWTQEEIAVAQRVFWRK